MGGRINRIQDRVGIHARTIRDILVREGCYGPRKRRLPDALRREFRTGEVYRFRSKRAQGPSSRYARDADHMKLPDSTCEGRFGINWLFRTPAGWSFCLTDAQASLDYETEVSSWTGSR